MERRSFVTNEHIYTDEILSVTPIIFILANEPQI